MTGFGYKCSFFDSVFHSSAFIRLFGFTIWGSQGCEWSRGSGITGFGAKLYSYLSSLGWYSDCSAASSCTYRYISYFSCCMKIEFAGLVL